MILCKVVMFCPYLEKIKWKRNVGRITIHLACKLPWHSSSIRASTLQRRHRIGAPWTNIAEEGKESRRATLVVSVRGTQHELVSRPLHHLNRLYFLPLGLTSWLFLSVVVSYDVSLCLVASSTMKRWPQDFPFCALFHTLISPLSQKVDRAI